MTTRRTLLTSGATVMTLTAGCVDRFSGSPSTTSRSGSATQEPIFVDEETGWHGDLFRTELFLTPDSLQEALNEDALPGTLDEGFTDFDPSEFFVSIFASKLELHSTGTTKGWCPRPEIKDETVVFSLPLAEWPDELDDPYEELVTIDLWQRNRANPPESATVQVNLVSEIEADLRTCSD
ncbi:hypothetical protein G6M89_14675 [Natronolimnobius sp. AArcel1]|uniref:hypothetical protein n=1 Tax=Natronolimnobius sp. AArcel1 TaxID=1679093 RepID=UPI0013E99ED4|nr:hypothetical protein [Natronolimnobius sp. AArcel1]NGM70239.1 hypothetical protein [Natronolimnobius sp. AArcel1]